MIGPTEIQISRKEN